MAPDPPEAGQPAMATITVQNLGGTPAADVTLVYEVSQAAGVRSATTPGGACATTSRRATCELGAIPAGGEARVEVRLLGAEDPSARTLVQRISLSSGGSAGAGAATGSTLLAAEEPSTSLLALPGTTVTLIAFVGFVLAAHSTRYEIETEVAAAEQPLSRSPRRRRRRR